MRPIPTSGNRGSYLAGQLLPLAEAGVLELVDDDQTIMPGVRVRTNRRTHACTIRSCGSSRTGSTRSYVGDIMPTTAHLPDGVDHGVRPLSDGDAGGEEGVRHGSDRAGALVFFAARSGGGGGRIREHDGKRRGHQLGLTAQAGRTSRCDETK